MFRELLEHGGGSSMESPALQQRALANCMREDPMVVLELQRWWARAALQSVQTVDKKRLAVHEHAQLYQRLNFALATRAGREPLAADAIEASAERDWKRMREQKQAADFEAFTLALYALVVAWHPPSPPSPSVPVASLLHELHDLAFVRCQSASSSRPASAKVKESEKREETTRSQRSKSDLRRVSGVALLLKSSASLRRLDQADEVISLPTATAMDEDASPQSQVKQRLLAHKAQSSRLVLNDHNGVAPGLSSRFTRHLSSPLSLLLPSTQEHPSVLSSTSELSLPATSSISGSDEDYASHFFSIETRLELTARLEELQTKLSSLLVQTKLAWMRCFADNGGDAKAALPKATELVERGEELTSHLLQAFTMATATTNCPIDEFQTLVECTEKELESFQMLVHAIAVENRPSAQLQESGSSISGSTGRDRHHSETQDAVPVPYLRHPVSFDLPSMKTYCAKVAPPYASYARK